MQKKYQVFVSSTYTDLIDERQDVIRAILDLGHIPSGMELFPAADDEQFSYISKVIDGCDYYVLIVGGRYGSVDERGISFTEREYDHAHAKGLHVLAFVHEDINTLAHGRVDTPDKIEKLRKFIEKISARRMVTYWRDRESLETKVIKSLSKAFSDFPQTGWVRANTDATEEILNQVVSLRNDIDLLSAENASLKAQLTPIVSNLAPLTNTYKIRFREIGDPTQDRFDVRELILAWDQIFAAVGPTFFKPATNDAIAHSIKSLLSEHFPFLLLSGTSYFGN